MIRTNNAYPEVAIGSLAYPEPGSFKIGPFGSSLKKDELVAKGIPVIGIENILSNKFVPTFRKFITGEKFEQLSQYLIKPGDVLVTTMGTIGRAAVVPENIGPAIIDSHLFRMRIDQSKVDPTYLCYGINGYGLQQALARMASGAIMAGLNTTILKTCRIPLPPLSDQKCIATILNEEMAAVEQARIAAETQLEAAKALPSAYLRAIFNSSEARRWSIKRIGEVGEIVSGVTLGRKTNGMEMRLVPYLRVANVKDGHLDLSNVYQIEATEVEIKKLRLQFGDILLTEGGDPDKLGRGMFWENQIPECIHQNHIFRVRFYPNEILSQFISAQIGSPYGKAYFLTHAKQTTGIATINQKVLSNFPLMVPPLLEQQRIAACLTEQMTAVDQTRKALEAQLATVNVLPAAFLRRAFSGELSPRWSTKVQPKLPKGIFFKRASIASYIVNHLHRQATFGRVQFVKVLYLTESYVGIDLSGAYKRKAAGPLDSDFLYKLESLAKKQRWFTKHPRGAEGFFYKPGVRISDRLRAAETILSNRRSAMDRLLQLIEQMKTEQVELLATLYAAWNDFLIDGNQPTDDQIIREVRENWHTAKGRFSLKQLHDMLSWMREHEITPHGTGSRTEVIQ